MPNENDKLKDNAERRVPKYDKNPFEKLDITNFKLSEDFINKEKEIGIERKIIMQTYKEYTQSHSNKSVHGFQEGIKRDKNYVDRDFDYRNIFDFISLLMEPGCSEEQVKDFTNQFCSQLFSSKEERNKLLDRIYDEFDTSKPEYFDLSCLSGNDKGEKGPDGLTDSERDLIQFQKVCKAEQAFRTTRYGFRDYFMNRYGSFEKMEELNFSSQKLMTSANIVSALYRINELNFANLVYEECVYIQPYDKYMNTKMTLMNDVSEIQEKLDSGDIQPEQCNSVVKLGLQREDDAQTLSNQSQAIAGNLQGVTNNTIIGNNVLIALGMADCDTLYIDGIRALEYLEPLKREDPYMESPGQTLDRVMSEGKHRFEVVSFGINKDGDLTPIVQTVEPFDNDFYKEDPGRERRVNNIREDMNNRLGPNKRFYNFIQSNSIDMSEEAYDEIIDRFRKNDKEKADALKAEGKISETKPEKSFEEKLETLKGELSAIDTWYHRNSTEFKNTLEALKSKDKQRIVDACTAYINKYVKENQSFRRRTDLGNARLEKMMEIMCAVKDQQKEEKERNFEKIEKTAKENRVSLKDRQLVTDKEFQKEENLTIGKEAKKVSLTKKTEFVISDTEKEFS